VNQSGRTDDDDERPTQSLASARELFTRKLSALRRKNLGKSNNCNYLSSTSDSDNEQLTDGYSTAESTDD